MILDLTVFKKETLDIKMMDGQVLHIRKPSQNMVIEIIKFRDINMNAGAEKIVAASDSLVLMILNDNTDGVTMDAKSVAALDYEIKVAILEGYAAFVNKVQSNPI